MRRIAGRVMKQVRWIVVIVFMETLAACDVQVPVTPEPYVSTNAFETAKEYLIRGDSFSATKDYAHAILDYDEAIRLIQNTPKPTIIGAMPITGMAMLLMPLRITVEPSS